MREAQRSLVRACIEEDAAMPFEDIVARTGLSPERTSELLADVMAENGCMTKFLNNNLSQDPIVSPWDITLDDELLEKYKKEIDDKTSKIKPLLIMKLYMEFEADKQIAERKLVQMAHTPARGSRWLELKMKARNEQIKLLGLEAAEEVNVTLGLKRDKNERDAIFAASQARNLLPAGAI